MLGFLKFSAMLMLIACTIFVAVWGCYLYLYRYDESRLLRSGKRNDRYSRETRHSYILDVCVHSIPRVTRSLHAHLGQSIKKFGRVEPITWVILYVCCIPCFAVIFDRQVGAFYAPYAKLEPGAIRDQTEVGNAITMSVRNVFQQLETRRMQDEANGDKSDWKVLADDINLGKMEIVGNEISLVYGVHLVGKEFDAYANCPVEFAIFHGLSGSKDRYLTNIEIRQDKITFKPLADYLKRFYVFSNLSFGPPTKAIGEAISRFTDGYSGDPTAFSDHWSRMLYFSVVVITTLGFGDIVPLTSTARLLTASEAVLGVVLMGLFLNSVATGRSQ